MGFSDSKDRESKALPQKCAGSDHLNASNAHDRQRRGQDSHNAKSTRDSDKSKSKSKRGESASIDCKAVVQLASDMEKLADQTTRRHSAVSEHSGQSLKLLSTNTGDDKPGNMLQVPGANNVEKRRSKSVSEVEPEIASKDMTSQHTSRPRSGSASKGRSSFGFHRSRSGSRKGSRKRKGSTASRTSGMSLNFIF